MPKGSVWAALDLGHFGAKLWRRDRDGAWREMAVPVFPPKPEDAGDDPHPWSLGKIWVFEAGRGSRDACGRARCPAGSSAPTTAARPGR